MAQAQKGDQVKVHYTGRLADGTMFDTSREREPLEFEVGSDGLIAGFSNGVEGMEVGQEITVTVAPEDGYGPRHEEMVREVPREALPEGVDVGDPLRAQTEHGEIQVWVKDLGEENAVIDGNHPLAGQTLVFDIELLEIVPTA
ncbi:peptidylprolyl isomerase [bacterium]|nr:peptidylprolyl isomerase [bacterium]